MNTLKEHTILYDAACPMCRLYTGAFVKTGMLDKLGRAPYQELQEGSCPMVDRVRAVNEIALVDRQTGAVTYGTASLFKILAHSWPLLRSLFAFGPFAWLISKLYSFISFNRRIIVPAREDARDRPPAMHRGWRLAWVVASWLFTAFVLVRYSHQMEGLVPASNVYREFAVCGGQIAWQGLVLLLINRKKTWDYLSNMMTVSLAGGLLLALATVVFNLFGGTHPAVAVAAFLLVAGLMLLEHWRRCKLLGLNTLVSISWVCYRLVVLFFIMN